ncbi:hypothetical protein FM037_08365 [Shewanella psychropiezotolerans]|uniref:GGDEF domain-containing protein n=2 Tax=Shewanellaceae TaxID=267890 RepID=A0ABX5X1T2_9GAMM|nr:hypothetical protein [Shewanella sp. YLB-07]QDO83241.1 hypothetical protein FM037_08365 [Shewanella psychropiezotolerans]
MKIPLGVHHWLASISVGLAVQSGFMSHYHELIKQADNSLYQAKSSSIFTNEVNHCQVL